MMGMVSLMLTAAGAAAEPCALQGWSNDTDPAGLRVHAGPALGSAEIGRLPPAVRGEDTYAPNFDIVDVRGGWVRIARADDLDKPGKARAVFRGTGWVHASRVAFTVQSEVGRSASDLRGKPIVRASGWLGDAGGTGQPIVACAGGWARLRYRLPGEVRALVGARSGEAWFGGICGNQHTTCDSLDETKSRSGRSPTR